MKKIFVIPFFVFFISACFNSDETKSVISKELENKNVQDNIVQEKNKSIQVDFEKDLDWFFEKAQSGSKN